MSRGKGEKPVLKQLKVLTADTPVVRAIASGSRWFDAWIGQECTPIPTLSSKTGIPSPRLLALCQSGPVSRAEIDALARAWSVSSASLINTLPDPSLVIE